MAYMHYQPYPQTLQVHRDMRHMPITKEPRTFYPMNQNYSAPPYPLRDQPYQATFGQPMFSESPTRVVCPYCNHQIVPIIDYKVGMKTVLMCLVLLILFGYLGCCLIPFCVDSCKDPVQSCPHCLQTIGRVDS